MTRQTSIRWLKAVAYIGIYGGLLMPVFFWPVVIFPFVFSKLIFFQFLIGLTFPAYLILAWIEPRYRPKPTILYVSIIAYFIALGASVVFSVDPGRSWWGNQERMNGLFTLLHFLAWLSMATGLLKNWVNWRRLLNYQICLSVFMAIVALLQKPFPSLLSFPAGDRVGGLLDNPIYMGSYQIFNLFFIALLLLKKPTKGMKIFYALAAVLDIGAFIAAQSRGAMLGLAVGIFVFAVVYSILTPSKKARRLVLAGLLACIVGYGLLFAFRDYEPIKGSVLERFTRFSVTTRTRFIAWEIAWKGFLEKPITGWGFDAFHILFNAKYNPESLHFGYYETWFDRSHNTILDVLSMTGLFGFVTFAAIFIALFVSVFRARKKGWLDVPITSILVSLPIAYFVQNLFVFDHPAAFSMSYLLFALVIAASSGEFMEKGAPVESGETKQTANLRQVPWVAFGVLQLAALLLVWRYSVLPFKASMYSIKANQAVSQGQYEASFNFAKQAFATPTPYLDEQSFLQSRNFIALAGKLQSIPFWREWHDLIVKISEKHLSEHPSNVHPHFIFAKFSESMGALVPEDVQVADREYRKALELSPKRQQLYFSYARFLINTGRKEEAVEYLKQVISFDEDIGEAHWMLGLSYMFDLKDLAKGAEEVIKSRNVKVPYQPQDAREALALAMAYDTLGDKDGLKKLMDLLPTLPQAQIEIYVQIAKTMEHQGLMEERNKIINALMRIDKNISARFMPLITGEAKNIDESYSMTEDLSGIVTTPAATSTTVATSSNGGNGPRR